MCREEQCCQERGQLRCVAKRGAQSLVMDQWQILVNGPAGPESTELNNVTLHRDNITELSCQEGGIDHGKLELWQSLANGHGCDRLDDIGKAEHPPQSHLTINHFQHQSNLSDNGSDKPGLSSAKLSSSLYSYVRWANCFHLDCLPCKNCQYDNMTNSHVRH